MGARHRAIANANRGLVGRAEDDRPIDRALVVAVRVRPPDPRRRAGGRRLEGVRLRDLARYHVRTPRGGRAAAPRAARPSKSPRKVATPAPSAAAATPNA